MAYTTSSRVGAFEAVAHSQSWLDALSLRFAKYKLYRQTLSELGQLTARELADLGIHRSQIRSIALEAAYGSN